MTFDDEIKAARRQYKAARRKAEAKYGRQALARLKQLGRRDKLDYIDMSDDDFNAAVKQVKKPVVDQQQAAYQDSRLKSRLDALSNLAGVDFAGMSLDDFNGLLDNGLRQALTDWKNRQIERQKSHKNVNPFA